MLALVCTALFSVFFFSFHHVLACLSFLISVNVNASACNTHKPIPDYQPCLIHHCDGGIGKMVGTGIPSISMRKKAVHGIDGMDEREWSLYICFAPKLDNKSRKRNAYLDNRT